MPDYSNMTDEELAKIAGVQLAPKAYAAPAPAVQSAAQPATSPSPVSAAILSQESGNRNNTPNSIDGAVGPGQILPTTFAMYAKPGEDIKNPEDNRAVHARIMEDYAQRYPNDPARQAVAYFSGPGNVAPANSPTPYIHDYKDGNGKTTSGYVADVLARIGNAIMPSANAAEPTGATPAAASQAASAAPIIASAAAPSAPSPATAPVETASNNAPIDQYAHYSDEKLAEIAGVDLKKAARPSIFDGEAKYLGEVGHSIKEGVKTLASLADPETHKGPIIDPIVSMKRADKMLDDWDNGNYLGVSRAALNTFNDVMRNSTPGRILRGGAEILGSPVAPVYNAGVDVLKAAGVPDDLIEGASNLSPLLGVRGAFKRAPAPDVPAVLPDIPIESTPAAPPGAPPGSPPPASHAAVEPAIAAPTGAQAHPQSAPATATGGASAIQPTPAPEPFLKPREKPPESLLKTDEGKPLVVSNKAMRKGQDITYKAFKDEGITSDMLNLAADRLEKAKADGAPVTAIDVLTETPGEGRNLIGLLSAAINRPGQGAKMAGSLALRGKQAAARFDSFLDQSMSGQKFYDVQAMNDSAKSATSPMYKEAFKANPVVDSPEINRILKTPAGKEALSDAATVFQNRMQRMSKPDPELAEQARLTGMAVNGGIGKGLSLEALHEVKIALDNQINAAKRQVQNGSLKKSQYGALVELKNDFVKAMDEADSTKSGDAGGLYQQARAKYSDAAHIQDALERGRDFLKLDPEEIQAFMRDKDVTTAEKTAFATGARRAIKDTLSRRRDGTNPVMALNNPRMIERIAAIVDDPAKAANLEKYLTTEQHMHDINGVLGGSPTAPRLEYAKAIDKKSTKAGTIAKTVIEPQGALANAVGNVLDKQFEKQAKEMSNDTAATIVRMLTTSDPAALRYMATQIK